MFSWLCVDWLFKLLKQKKCWVLWSWALGLKVTLFGRVQKSAPLWLHLLNKGSHSLMYLKCTSISTQLWGLRYINMTYLGLFGAPGLLRGWTFQDSTKGSSEIKTLTPAPSSTSILGPQGSSIFNPWGPFGGQGLEPMGATKLRQGMRYGPKGGRQLLCLFGDSWGIVATHTWAYEPTYEWGSLHEAS